MTFKKTICNKEIFIHIEKDLFDSQKEIFLALLSTFKLSNIAPSSKFLITSNKLCMNNSYYCDINNEKWVFLLLNALEDYFAITLNCTVLHGSCIKLSDNTIAIIGERKSGKTTLTKYMIDQKKAKYLTDDSIYIVNNYYCGFNMPIPMRNTLFQFGNMICTSSDDEGSQRIIYSINNCFEKSEIINYILFPKYNEANTVFNVNRVKKSKLFNILISNVRHMENMNVLFKDLSLLTNNAISYCIQYSQCDEIFEWLYNIITTNKQKGK